MYVDLSFSDRQTDRQQQVTYKATDYKEFQLDFTVI